jgi:hypothetical protein
LIAAIAVTSKLRLADTESAEYLALVPAGTIVPDDAPAGIPRNAAEAIDYTVDMARRGDFDARRSNLTFVRSWPEIAIEQPGQVIRFRAAGANAAHWERDGHRTATMAPSRRWRIFSMIYLERLLLKWHSHERNQLRNFAFRA